ncbi:MAG: glycosyltransferase family 4 protein [Desulfobaccales bacterium]
MNRHYLLAFAPKAVDKVIIIPIGVPFINASRTVRSCQPPYRLLAIGRLVPKKGFPTLITACHYLAKWGLNFHLILAGNGAQRARLMWLIQQYGLQKWVTLAGFLPHRQIAELLGQVDLLIAPSCVAPSGDRDGIPTVILEAMLHKVPVVATDVSGIPEVILPGETGWLTPPSDPQALARVILEALADPTEARCRAQRGHKLVKKQFDSQKNYALLKTCLEKQISPIEIPISNP